MNYLIVDDEVILLRDMERLAREVLPEDSQIYTADNWKSALQLVEQYKPYVVFLDVDMPEMNGLQISGRIEEISPKSNIIFVTGFPEYSLDAWNTNASDFLVKPVLKRDLEKAMGKLRVLRKEDRLCFSCFGNFDVSCRGQSLRFERKQSKEFLAYLVDRRGAEASENEIRAILWEDSVDTDSKKSYIRTLASDIRKTLESAGFADIFQHTRGGYSLDVSKADCDYWQYIDSGGKTDTFRGEYMTQYSWAEETLGALL